MPPSTDSIDKTKQDSSDSFENPYNQPNQLHIKDVVAQYYFLNLLCNIFLPGLGHLFITEEFIKGICFMGLFININIVIACLYSTPYSLFSLVLIPINVIIWAGVIADGQKIFELKIFHCKN